MYEILSSFFDSVRSFLRSTWWLWFLFFCSLACSAMFLCYRMGWEASILTFVEIIFSQNNSIQIETRNFCDRIFLFSGRSLKL